MKKNFIIAGILCAISLVCAFAIAGINFLTSSIIENTALEKEATVCKSIFSDYDSLKSTSVSGDALANKDSRIKKVITAKDSSGKELGTIYTVTGTNDYGEISLMVAVKDNKVVQVEFLSNTQSFASTVNSHVKNNYPSSEDNVIYPLIKPEGHDNVGELDQNQINSVDASCGATYGAKLVKDLVSAALNDAKGVN